MITFKTIASHCHHYPRCHWRGKSVIESIQICFIRPMAQSSSFLYPVSINFFKVNNGNTRIICEICSKLPITTSDSCNWCRSGVVIVDFVSMTLFSLNQNQRCLATEIVRTRHPCSSLCIVEVLVHYLSIQCFICFCTFPVFDTWNFSPLINWLRILPTNIRLGEDVLETSWRLH